jgi:ABC-type Zn uptake system ZnuABC Zn-binding protein ZnuA
MKTSGPSRRAVAALSLVTLLWPVAALARVNVVASLADLADISREVGGDRVSVVSLSEGYQDPHHVDARFSLVSQLSRANLYVHVGMDLDGWADALADASHNGAVQRGARGNVVASAGLRALEVPAGQVRPDMGDIHVYGNPHFLVDPLLGKLAARNIRDGLKRVDPSGASVYDARYESFAGRIDASLQRWQAELAPYRGQPVVTYHKTFAYFLNRFGLRELDTLEPRPGIAPSLGHVAEVIQEMKSARVKVLISENFRSRRYPDMVAKQTGCRLAVVPASSGSERGVNTYMQMLDALVTRVAAAFRG